MKHFIRALAYLFPFHFNRRHRNHRGGDFLTKIKTKSFAFASRPPHMSTSILEHSIISNVPLKAPMPTTTKNHIFHIHIHTHTSREPSPPICAFFPSGKTTKQQICTISISTGVTILVSQTVLSVLIRRVITKTSEAIPLLGIAKILTKLIVRLQ